MRNRGGNRLRLGLFGANCSGGLAITTAPEQWDASWENNLALARMADDAGLDFMLPLGRWKGYGGETDHNGANFETLTWAAGILASTRNITAFGTVHVPLYNPVVAAKQMVTVDHIGRGRFGLNIVCGWNVDEFEMTGVSLDGHDRRYDQGQEWIDIITAAWREPGPFDYEGEFYRVRRTHLMPKPHGGDRPTIVCAGNSERGRDFAARNADMMFTSVRGDDGEIRASLNALKKRAQGYGNEIGVFTNVAVVCRPTRKEAEDYYHYYAVEMADRQAVENLLTGRGADTRDMPVEAYEKLLRRTAGGHGALPIIGDPAEVAAEFVRLNECGMDALAIGFANYLDHLPYFRDEVLPRLVDAGVRAA
jgi:alkanesulfonate monooxygenase SsuD/methylene tetrahydromethanopterin reductase-like flavin-dependent oxidoreductase (luciferase family)